MNISADSPGASDAPRRERLRAVLLAAGGGTVNLPPIEEDMSRLLRRGRFWPARGAILMPGTPNMCHANSAACWEANPGRLSLCTGYALSGDGGWRQHSWCITTDGRAVVETTVRRVRYFGFRMSPAEAREFLDMNL